jgi:hypothetical protein
VVVEFLSAAPRPDGIQEAPPRNQIETSRGLRLLYVHESHAREPKPPLVGIERRKLGLKSPPGAIPNLGVSFQIIQTPKDFRADSTCGLASQPMHIRPACPDSALDRSVLRDFKATQTGDIGCEQPERQEEGDNHKPGVRNPRAKCAAVT